MATLLLKTRALSQTTTNETSDIEVVDFLNAGAIFLINSIPKDLLTFMATDSSNITSSAGYDHGSDRVVMVRRNGIICDELPKEHIYAHASALTATSLFAGSTIFPKFYELGGKIFIKPNPSAVEAGVVSYIAIPSITSSTTTTTLDEIENPMVLYAAALDAMAASAFWSAGSLGRVNSTTGAGRDALDKARDLIDNSTALTQGQDVEFFLNDEDPEMIASGIGIASQEVTRALAEVKGMEGTNAHTVRYLQQAQQLFAQAEREVAAYVNRNSRMIALQLAAGQGGDNG